MAISKPVFLTCSSAITNPPFGVCGFYDSVAISAAGFTRPHRLPIIFGHDSNQDACQFQGVADAAP
jgi:hypothetical protein